MLVIFDEIEIRQAIKSNDFLFAISAFDNWLRNEGKYHGRFYETDEPGEGGYKKTVREKLSEFLTDNGIDMDELYP